MRKFFICNHCKNIITKVDDKKVPVFCCGEKMQELVANSTEAATEKHLPVITVNGNNVNITVSSVSHPMLEEHHIEWVFLETTNGGQLRYLNPNGKPEANFSLCDDEKVLGAYAYCNLHGLWYTEA